MSKVYEMYMEEMECGELMYEEVDYLLECPLCGCEVEELTYGVCGTCANH